MRNHRRLWAMFITLILLAFSACAFASSYQAGTYTAVAQGNNGPIEVSVAFDGSAILTIEIVSHSETPGISDPAFERIPAIILESQSLAVDAISGATNTSNAILEAVSDCVKQAGGDVEALKAKTIQNNAAQETIVLNADAVIVGAGGAGINAAVELVKAGKSVIVLEKLAAVGGNTIISGSSYNAVLPEYQQKQTMGKAELEAILKILELEPVNDTMKAWQDTLAAEIDEYQKSGASYLFDSVTLHKLQTYIGGDYVGNPELISIMCEGAPEGFYYLSELGAQWSNTVVAGMGATWVRTMTPLPVWGSKGSSFILPQKQFVEESGKAQVLTEYKAEALICEGNRVVGVRGTTGNGSSFECYGEKGVLLATGGFAANVEMRQEYNTHWANLDESITTSNGAGSTGDGIKMAKEIGANLVGMEWIQIVPGGSQIIPNVENMIYVNEDGNRFVREDGRRDEMSAAMLEQTGKMWKIYNAHCLATAESLGKDVDSLINNKTHFKAESLEELAELIGVNYENLKSALDNYNACVANETADEFGRTLHDQQLNQAPYFACNVFAQVHYTMGGVEIDAQTHVLNEQGEIIPGLYAAGEVTGGIQGSNRLGGNSISDIVVFGRIAGQTMAAE